MNNKKFIILMMGYTGAGKSTVAKKLAETLGLDEHYSAIVRKELGFKFSKKEAEENFFLLTSKKREAMDKTVYGQLAEKARESLNKGKNVIIDAGHFFKWQRNNLYTRVAGFNPEIFIIRVECPEDIILERLKARKKNFSESEFNETPSVKTYYSSKQATEPANDDLLPNGLKPQIISYNTFTKEIKIEEGHSNKNLNNIYNSLKKI